MLKTLLIVVLLTLPLCAGEIDIPAAENGHRAYTFKPAGDFDGDGVSDLFVMGHVPFQSSSYSAGIYSVVKGMYLLIFDYVTEKDTNFVALDVDGQPGDEFIFKSAVYTYDGTGTSFSSK